MRVWMTALTCDDDDDDDDCDWKYAAAIDMSSIYSIEEKLLRETGLSCSSITLVMLFVSSTQKDIFPAPSSSVVPSPR